MLALTSPSDVIYGETVLEFGHSSALVRNPGIEHLMQFFSCPPVAASLLKWRLNESDEEGNKCLKVRSARYGSTHALMSPRRVC